MSETKATAYRYRDQIDYPNGARIWPTYWAKAFPDSPERIHGWNVDHPQIGFIASVQTKERAVLIVRSVNQREGLIVALDRISKMYHADTCSHALVEEHDCNCHVAIALAALAQTETEDLNNG